MTLKGSLGDVDWLVVMAFLSLEPTFHSMLRLSLGSRWHVRLSSLQNRCCLQLGMAPLDWQTAGLVGMARCITFSVDDTQPCDVTSVFCRLSFSRWLGSARFHATVFSLSNPVCFVSFGVIHYFLGPGQFQFFF